MGKISRITRLLIFIPVAVMAWVAPSTVHAESDSLPFTPANNGCGPYQAFTVTGSSGGAIWGSNPYTDDSKFSAAAVHAGLIAVGETAIIEPYLVDNYPSYGGSAANGISTYTWGSSWCGYYIRILGTGEETTTTTTTTLAPYFNSVTNLIAVAKPDGSVDLGWDAPTASNIDIYAYSVSFYDLDEIGGTASGGWGVWTNQGTIYSLAEYMFSGSNPVTTGYGPVRFGIKAGNKSCFSNQGVGPCVYGQETTVDVTVLDPTPPSTTTTEPETTTTTQPEPTTTTQPEPEITQPETTTTEPETVVAIPETTTTVPESPPSGTTTTVPLEEETTVETPTNTDNSEDTESTTSLPQYAPEQEATTDETPIEVPEDTQDAADAAVADIFDTPISDDKLADAVDDLVADAETPEELTAVVTALLDQELTDAQFATVIDSVFSEPLSDENFAAAIDAVFADPTQLSDAQFEDAVAAVFDAPLSDEQFQDAVAAVFEDTGSLSDEQFDSAVQAVFDEPLSTEQFAEALGAVFDEPLSDEKFDAIINAVLDEPISNEQFEELVNVLESDTVTEEQVSAAVDSVIENGVTEDQAVDLATSEKVLQSIDGEQAAEIFDAVDISNINPEEAAQLVAAVQNAPTEVRESLESEINVFDGAIDTYVPLGSGVSVGVRRVIVAAAGVLFVAPTIMPITPIAPLNGSGNNNPSPNGGGGASVSTEPRRRVRGK